MWAKFRASNIRKNGKELRNTQKSFNINDEYLSALRTQSYAEFFTKGQSLVRESTSKSSNYVVHHCEFSETILLQPRQEAIPSLLESPVLMKLPELKGLLVNYFDISAEAAKLCIHLLENIKETQSNSRFIQQSLDSIEKYSSQETIETTLSELNWFPAPRKPFSCPDKHNFKLIHDDYESVLRRLNCMRKRVARKIRLIKLIKRVSGICFTAACGLVAIAALILAAHTLTALVMGPALFGFPLKSFHKKLLRHPMLRYGGFLSKVGEQLDAAAKGTYILNRDFDTTSRLVARLVDAIEHNRAMMRLCLERKGDKFAVQAVEELKKSNLSLRKQVEELEEHLFLCLVTINRARALVVKQMASDH